MSITLDCGAAGERTIHGSGFDVVALLEPHPRVEVRATGLGSQWSHLAVYDLSGTMLFGTYDLSRMAEDVREWFTPLQREVVVDVCELELERACPQERIAIDFMHQGDVARIYDRNAGELAGYEIVPTGVREHPDATMDCPAEPTLRGWFTVHQPP